MSVFRVHKTENYTTMSNHHLRNGDLSLQAKGLLSVILSLPSDWNYSIHGLAQISKEGDKAIKSTLDELKRHGYLVVRRINPGQGHNRVQYEYDVYEEPVKPDEPEKPQVAQAYPSEGVQGEGVQREGVQAEGVLKGGQLNKEEPSKEELNTNSSSTDHSSSSAQTEATREAIKGIIDYFNERVGTHYTYRNKTINGLIHGRLSEGFTVADFETVIDNKVASWKGTEWEQYLRPKTLFAPSHFEDYLNERRKKERQNADYSVYDRAFGR